MTIPSRCLCVIGTAISGVGHMAGALIYGCLLVVLDLAFSAWRTNTARSTTPSMLGIFISTTFLARLLFILAGTGLALNLFNRTGVLTVFLTYTLSLPLRAAAVAILARSREG